MVRAEKIIDIDEQTNLVALTEDVQASGETAVLQHKGKPVAKLVPVVARKPSRSDRRQGVKRDLFSNLMGIGSSGLTDLAENHDKYLAADNAG